MAQLAIKGHKTRDKEVIALLEMLGGKNESLIIYDGRYTDSSYRITDDGCIVSSRFCPNKKGIKYQTYTLEEFEKEFPYKVGDEVRLGVSDEVRITNMYWDSCSDQVIYEALSVNGGREYDNLHAKQLSPCKEQTSPDKAKAPALEGQDYSEGRCSYKIPEGFEFEKVENDEIILKPKKKEFPKTYEECCEVLGISELPYMVYTWNRNEDVEVVLLEPQVTLLQQLEKLRRIITCRDAYWKLADDWSFNIGGNSQETVYAITICGTGILRDFYHALNCNRILVFPTEDMRDAFYEKFRDLIDECKELL